MNESNIDEQGFNVAMGMMSIWRGRLLEALEDDDEEEMMKWVHHLMGGRGILMLLLGGDEDQIRELETMYAKVMEMSSEDSDADSMY